MRRTEDLANPFYQRRFKEIYKLLFTADLDEISDHSNWFKPNPSYVEQKRPLWIIIESKILNKRIWITKDFGELEIATAQLDLSCNSNAYSNSYKRVRFKNQKEMTDYLEILLQPCLLKEEKIAQAKFFTKIVNPEENYTSHNGEIVEIIDFQKGKDVYCDRYTVRFNDGSIASNIMSCELDFDYSLDNKKDEEEPTI